MADSRAGRAGKSLMLAFVVASAALLACFTASASARPVHVFSKSFGNGELSLVSNSGIAVDQETGEVYVADTSHARIAKYTEEGAPDGALTGITSPTFIAIDNSTGSAGDIYVVEGADTVSKRDPTGALVTAWGTGGHMTFTEELLGIAVDPGGNLWVLSGQLGSEVVPGHPEFGREGTTITGTEFAATGAPTGSWTAPQGTGIRGEAMGTTVNSADTLALFPGNVISGKPVHNITLFDSSGNVIRELSPSARGGVAFEPTSGDLYLGASGGTGGHAGEEVLNVIRLSASLEPVEKFGGKFEGTEADEQIDEPADGLKSIASLVAAEGGPVYVVDSVGGKVAMYGIEEVVPPTVTIEPPDGVTQTSAHVVGHVNPGVPTGSPSSHDVRWEFKCVPACSGHTGYIEVEKDGSEQTLEATLSGLEAGTEYTVSLFGENRGGSSETPAQPFTTAAAPPSAKTELASEVVRGGATLNGVVNSNGLETTYLFEYTTKAAFEAEEFRGAESTAEAGPLPAPAAPRSVSATINGLVAGGEYVYRIVATNSLGTTDGEPPAEFRAQIGPNVPVTDCPNQSLRTEAGARLPDCRAYEMVTPEGKNGSLVEPYPQGLQATIDGSGVMWFAGASATGVPSSQAGHQDYAFYLSSLSGEAWTSQRLLAPAQYGEVSDLVGLTGDGRYALIEAASHALPNKGTEARYAEPALYLLDTGNHSVTAIAPPQSGQETGPRAFAFDGASADDSRVFFESQLQLIGGAAPEKNNLYMWNRESGALSLVGVLPGAKGEAPAGGSFGGAYSWWGESPNLETGGAEEALYVEAVHAISESGDSVYFTAGKTGQLYYRHGLTGSKPTTVQVSVANSGVIDSHGEKPAAFQQATSDGSKAFFISSGKLTQNANTGSSDAGSDLYRYDSTAKPPLVDVSPLPGGAGARVRGLLGVSADGKSGFLVAEGILAGEGEAVEGDSNVYHFQEESDGTFAYTFVADLGVPGNGTSALAIERNWSPTANSPKTARVSEDGGTLLFMSHRGLTGFPEANCIVAGECAQVYRYSVTEGLACLSCNPTGEGAPRFGAELAAENAQAFPPGNVAAHGGIWGILPANLSSSGDQVFFQSSEALLPEDVNGAEPEKNCESGTTCVDVYEWEAPGSGSCGTPNYAGGCLYLLSTGENDRGSYFLNASADGSSAFILTSSPLVPADQDDLADVYDTRVDGGLTAQHAAPTEPCNSSEACKGPGSSSPPAGAAGTSSFQGPGNAVPPKPCKKGSVRKHGKCVKKPKKKSHDKKSHQKKKADTGKKKARSTGKKHPGGAK
jgi:hypothetical protein